VCVRMRLSLFWVTIAEFLTSTHTHTNTHVHRANRGGAESSPAARRHNLFTNRTNDSGYALLTFVPVKCFREQNVVSLVSVHLSACKSSCASNNACACACACVCECVRACVRACNTAVPSPLLNVCLGVLGLALWGSMGEACADFYW
jgi:hypothetical protein